MQGGHGVGFHHPPPAGGSAFFMPGVSLMGAGSLAAAGARIQALGLRKALVVTDAGLMRAGAVKAVTDVLESQGIAFSIYDGCQPNPTVEQVASGAAQLASAGCDCVISFGGGSPHDCAKGIAIVASPGNPDDIRACEGVNRMTGPMLPLVAVNTTAGTGSEMTRFAIITDTDRHVKMAIIDERCTPTLAVNDPLLMLAQPAGLTAATGMDALTHAVEAYVSTAATPITDACALAAVRLIARYLRRAVAVPGDVEAREGMAYAEFLAGMAFNSAGLGYVHAMAHQLGGLLNLPHGVCNAVLLPAVQEFNAVAVPDLFIDLAHALGVGVPGSDGPAAAEAALAAIRTLSADVAIPPNLAALGVKPEHFDLLATNAMKDACGATNPRAPTKEEVVALFKQAHEQ
jgi:alcohol dehydrogenase